MITTLPQLTLPVSFSFKSLCVKSCCYFQSFILLFLLLVIGKSSHGQADLAITISAAPEPVKDNGKVTFTIKVTNNGPGAALNPKVQTTILSTFDRNSFSFDTQASGWTGFYTYASGVLSLSNSNAAGFASGASATFVYTVNATAAAAGTVQISTATISSNTSDPVSSNNSDTANTTVISTNANLSALTTTAGTLTPSFGAGSTAYTASVNNATKSVTVTPTAANAKAVIQVRVNGGAYVAVTSGQASASLALNEGSNAIDITVTAQDGTTVKTYTITVTRAASADLTITMSSSPEPVADNGKVTFTIKVTNNGPGAALNPKVQTTILGTFDRNSFSFGTQASGWTGFYTYASGVLSLSNSNAAGFPSGASATFVYTVNATAAATGTVQTTTATVSSSTVDPDMSNDTTTVKTTVLPAATFNYYRTRQSGKWNDVNTWETSVDNLSWTNATLTPNFNAKAIIVRSTHAVTVTVNVTAIRTTVSAGGKLNINPGVNFTVR